LPGEIETQLKSKSSKISQAIVIVGKSSEQDSRQALVAFLQFSDTQGDSKNTVLPLSEQLRLRLQDLETAAKSALPNYMV
jgi:hypothetical protein